MLREENSEKGSFYVFLASGQNTCFGVRVFWPEGATRARLA
jgi:hypothetical protein